MKQNREKLFFLFLDDVVNLLGSFLRGRLDLKASGLFPSIDAINLTIYSPAWPAGPSLAGRRAR